MFTSIKKLAINLAVSAARPYCTTDNLCAILSSLLSSLLARLPADPATIAKYGQVISKTSRILETLGLAIQDGVISETETQLLLQNLTEALDASELTDAQLQTALDTLATAIKQRL